MGSKTEKRKADVIELPAANRHITVEVIRRVKSVMDNKMFYLLQGLTTDVTDALFEEMRDLEEQEALASHFNIMRVLKVQAGTYRQEFSDLLNISWTNLMSRKDQRAVADAEGRASKNLQLYSRKHRNHYKILLEEVRQRFCGITGQDLNFHPMLPANFYLCFWHATESLDLNYQERQLVMSLFHRFVMDRFGQLLAAVNDKMKELELEPVKL